MTIFGSQVQGGVLKGVEKVKSYTKIPELCTMSTISTTASFFFPPCQELKLKNVAEDAPCQKNFKSSLR